MLLLCLRMVEIINSQFLFHAADVLVQVPAMNRPGTLHFILRSSNLLCQFFSCHTASKSKRPRRLVTARAVVDPIEVIVEYHNGMHAFNCPLVPSTARFSVLFEIGVLQNGFHLEERPSVHLVHGADVHMHDLSDLLPAPITQIAQLQEQLAIGMMASPAFSHRYSV